MKTASLLLLLLAPVAVHAQPAATPTTIRFPSHVTAPAFPASSTKLTPATFYVIDSDTPIVVDASPRGFVSITEEAGPIKVRGVFVDGTGKVETRTFKGKHVYFVEAAASGKCELIVFAIGATKAADVIHKPLDVEAGEGPMPPPPTGKVTAYITFVGADKGQSLATNNDVTLRKWFADNGIKFYTLDANDPGIEKSGLTKAVEEAGGVPAAIAQDSLGKVIARFRITTSAQMKASVTPYLGSK